MSHKETFFSSILQRRLCTYLDQLPNKLDTSNGIEDTCLWLSLHTNPDHIHISKRSLAITGSILSYKTHMRYFWNSCKFSRLCDTLDKHSKCPDSILDRTATYSILQPPVTDT